MTERSIAGVLCLLCALGASAPGQDEAKVRDLVQKLYDDSIDVRADAVDGLVRLGPAARTPLQSALKDASGEHRLLILEVLRKIDDRQHLALVLGPATAVTIEAQDRPLRDVLDELKKQAATPLDFSAVPAEEKVSVRLSRAPFWDAVDAVCKGHGGLMYEITGDKVVFARRKYVARPRHGSGPFVVWLQRVEARDVEDFEGGNRSEQMTGMVQVSWEKGTKPNALRLRPLELTDDHGADLLAPAQNRVFMTPPSQIEISPQQQTVTIATGASRTPHPDAAALTRCRFEVSCDFILERSGVTFEVPENLVGASRKCDRFTALLRRFVRNGNQVQVQFTITPTDARPQGVQGAYRVTFKDKQGKEHHQPLHTGGWGRTAVTCQAHAQIQDLGDIAEVSVTAPSKTHTERILVDWKDVPLR